MDSHARAPAGATTLVLDELRRIVRALRESSRAAEKKLGVSGAQLFVLKALSGAEVSSLNDVAARTRTHQSTVSVVVTGLVRRGLVRRRPSADDRRRVDLSLSPRGKALLARAPLAAQERLVTALETLPVRARTTLAKTLGQVTAAMGLAAEAAPMFFEPTAKSPRPAGGPRVR